MNTVCMYELKSYEYYKRDETRNPPFIPQGPSMTKIH